MATHKAVSAGLGQVEVHMGVSLARCDRCRQAGARVCQSRGASRQVMGGRHGWCCLGCAGPSAAPGGVKCSEWGCTCQGMSDWYGTNSGVGWGCAPTAAQSWWKAQSPPCNTRNASYPCSDPPAPCHAPGCGAMPLPVNLTVFAQSRNLASKEPLPGLPYTGYPIVYDAAIHPAEVITRNAASQLLQVARNTVWIEGLASRCNPTNGFVLSWIPAARVVARANASRLLDNFTAAVRASVAKSWYHDHGGGGYEDVGATDAITSLLLTWTDGELQFFPGWPLDEAATFTRVRAYGAFLVSASQDENGAVSGVRIEAEPGTPTRNCTLVNPFGGPVRVTSEAGSVPVHDAAQGRVQFTAEGGLSYTLHPS